ncbi:MAG: rhamnulokinase, partial [Muribaculaceae bacterium]|nr:rhamnulokinase [Muribaculaceae bacterium]
MSHYLAIDLGATSGRTILGTLSPEGLQLEELTRFPNTIVRHGAHCYWDIWHLYEEMLRGLREAAARQLPITSIGIDTWGVDFVCIGADGQLLSIPNSYRDPHTEGEPQRYFQECIPAERLYEITGLQVMPFNSLFQFSAMRRQANSSLAAASKILFLPDALSYLLTGKMVTEYTIASTSHLGDAATRRLSPEILQSVGLTEEMFGTQVMPGTVIGTLTPEIQQLTGLPAIPVVAVAGHDTGSAVAAVPARDKEFAYLSSGTWSLMGIEIDSPCINPRSCAENFTHEGGVDGTLRFLKNICGMWHLER